MKIPKMIYHIKPIPSHPWWECKKVFFNVLIKLIFFQIQTKNKISSSVPCWKCYPDFYVDIHVGIWKIPDKSIEKKFNLSYFEPSQNMFPNHSNSFRANPKTVMNPVWCKTVKIIYRIGIHSEVIRIFRFIPISVSEPMRIIPNQSEKRFVTRLKKNGKKSIRPNPI